MTKNTSTKTTEAAKPKALPGPKPTRIEWRADDRSRVIKMPLPIGAAEPDAHGEDLARSVTQLAKIRVQVDKERGAVEKAQNTDRAALIANLADDMSDEAVDDLLENLEPSAATKAALARRDRLIAVRDALADAVGVKASKVFASVRQNAAGIRARNIRDARESYEILSGGVFQVQRAADALTRQLGIVHGLEHAEAERRAGGRDEYARLWIDSPAEVLGVRMALNGMREGLDVLRRRIDVLTAGEGLGDEPEDAA